MDMAQITVTLSNTLIERAKQAGILSDETIARLIEAEIERQEAAQSLFTLLGELQSFEPRPTPGEIAAEIKAYRAEKAVKRSQATDNQ
jgi:hypothetical protein